MSKTPFFLRFIETTPTPELTAEVKAGAARTKKYPSDGDEYVTLKYPSDNDEGGVDI